MVDSVREQLLARHDQFRELAQQHSQYSARLNSLCEKKFLTEEEQMEEVRLKKLKLRIKDQMHMIEREYRGGQVQVA